MNICVCGKLVKTKNNKYCSCKCSARYRRRISKQKIQIACLECKKIFSIFKSQYQNGRRKFCSIICKNKYKIHNLKGKNNPNWKGGKLIRICKMCGEKFETLRSIVQYGYGNFCSNKCKGRWVVKHTKTKDTKIEKLIEEELKKYNINYEKQYFVEKIAMVDFYLPNNKIIIQCDGDYWHSFKENKNRDVKQDFLLQFKGYKIYRFTETQINKSPRRCIKKILKEDSYENNKR